MSQNSNTPTNVASSTKPVSGGAEASGSSGSSFGGMNMTMIVHVCMEMVIVGFITYWLNSKIKSQEEDSKLLLERLVKCEEQIAKQNEIIAHHENALRQFHALLQGLPPPQNVSQNGGAPPVQTSKNTHSQPRQKSNAQNTQARPAQQNPQTPQNQKKPPSKARQQSPPSHQSSPPQQTSAIPQQRQQPLGKKVNKQMNPRQHIELAFEGGSVEEVEETEIENTEDIDSLLQSEIDDLEEGSDVNYGGEDENQECDDDERSVVAEPGLKKKRT